MSTRNSVNTEQPKDSFGLGQVHRLDNRQCSAVELRTKRGKISTTIRHSRLATDDHVVEMARQQCKISPNDFLTGEVVAQ